MKNIHELRRAKEKLKTLTETPYLNWVMTDLLDIVEEDLDLDLAGIDYGYKEIEKRKIMYLLKEKYEKFIKDNEEENSVQGKLGI